MFKNYIYYENEDIYNNFINWIKIIDTNENTYKKFYLADIINNNDTIEIKVKNLKNLNYFIINKNKIINSIIFIINNKSNFIWDNELILLFYIMKILKIVFIIYLDNNEWGCIEMIRSKYFNYLNNLIHKIKDKFNEFKEIELNYDIIFFSEKMEKLNNIMNIETAKNLLKKELKFKFDFQKQNNSYIYKILEKLYSFIYYDKEDEYDNFNKVFNNYKYNDLLFIIKEKYLLGNKGISNLEFINNYINNEQKYKIIKERPNLYTYPGILKIGKYEFLVNKETKLNVDNNIKNLSIIFEPEQIYELKKSELIFYSNNIDLDKVDNFNIKDYYEFTAIIYLIDKDIDYKNINFIVKFNNEVVKIKEISYIEEYENNLKIYKIILEKFIFFNKNLFDHSGFFVEDIRYNRIGRGYILK